MPAPCTAIHPMLDAMDATRICRQAIKPSPLSLDINARPRARRLNSMCESKAEPYSAGRSLRLVRLRHSCHAHAQPRATHLSTWAEGKMKHEG